MSGWGVLVTSAATSAPDRYGGALRERFDGLVIVRDGEIGPAHPTRLDYLLSGLRDVPPEARLVTLLDDDALSPHGVEALGRMLAALTAAQAGVVRAVPVTDALKRVDGRRIRGGVDRAGLFVPQTPQVLRRDVLEDALVASATTRPRDPATLLMRQGHSVGVVWGGQPSPASTSVAGSDR
ncbi:2-C-methyl-D-erythritol 4-phosphate cytidylyltransferase [Egibacter rhizosphaerae]|uniref:2-C-methyl-D-erythritol 4-phosphate cytidylyltransferase n=1 Tax=Egibacter rhizosphaerae TaxID=1670831 RepID=UPI0013F163B5|nr:2-C-methyl-D-erythritol 4-phosphate cytidylyltransferase [Egibacter rhizosphaerae]